MEEHVQARIDRAKELLAIARNASMATVNIDGTQFTPALIPCRANLVWLAILVAGSN